MKTMLTVAGIVASMGVIAGSILQLTGVWEKAHYLSMPMMGLMLLLQTVREWKEHRGVAVFSLVAAGFIFVCAAVVFFVK